jgi:hypothetical protein
MEFGIHRNSLVLRYFINNNEMVCCPILTTLIVILSSFLFKRNGLARFEQALEAANDGLTMSLLTELVHLVGIISTNMSLLRSFWPVER